MPIPVLVMIPMIELMRQAVQSGAEVERGRQQAAMVSEILEAERGMRVDMLDALVNRRAGILHQAFAAVLQIYAEQSRSLNGRLEKMLEVQLASDDPLHRAEIERASLSLQAEIRQLNANIDRLFVRMSDVLLLIGKDVVGVPALQKPSMLPLLERIR